MVCRQVAVHLMKMNMLLVIVVKTSNMMKRLIHLLEEEGWVHLHLFCPSYHCSSCQSQISVLSGLMAAFQLDIAPGGTIVLIAVIIFIGAVSFEKIKHGKVVHRFIGRAG